MNWSLSTWLNRCAAIIDRYLGTTPKLAEEAFRRRLEMEAAAEGEKS